MRDGCSMMLFVIVVFLVKLGMFLHLVSDAKSNAAAFTVSAWTPGNPLDKVIGAWSVAWLGFVVFGIIDQVESISFADFTTDVGYVAVGVNCINTEYFDAISVDTNPGSFSDSHSACSILVVMIGSALSPGCPFEVTTTVVDSLWAPTVFFEQSTLIGRLLCLNLLITFAPRALSMTLTTETVHYWSIQIMPVIY